MAKAKVWLPNKGSHAYHHASTFGEFHTLTEGRVNVFAIDTLACEIWKKLDDGGASADDYVLVSGYAVPNGIAMHYFLSKFGKVRLLQWGAVDQKYRVLTLPDPRTLGVAENK